MVFVTIRWEGVIGVSVFKSWIVIVAIAAMAIWVVSPTMASAPTGVTASISGPGEGWVDDELGYNVGVQYSLDEPTQTERNNGQASVVLEYDWSVDPADVTAGGGTGDSTVTVKYPYSAGGAYRDISVTVKVTVRYADGTSDSAQDSDTKQVKVKRPELTGLTASRNPICAGAGMADVARSHMVATVEDGFGQPASGKSVSFEVTQSTYENIQATVSAGAASSNDQGKAQVDLISSDKEGSATVKAKLGDGTEETQHKECVVNIGLP